MRKGAIDNARFISILFITIAAGAFFWGCSAITVPNPEDVAKCPLGSEAIKIVMTQGQVESLWGKPDDVRMVEDKNRWPSPREMWTYRASYGAIPLNCGYFSKTKKLYFDGENLTDIGE